MTSNHLCEASIFRKEGRWQHEPQPLNVRLATAAASIFGEQKQVHCSISCLRLSANYDGVDFKWSKMEINDTIQHGQEHHGVIDREGQGESFEPFDAQTKRAKIAFRHMQVHKQDESDGSVLAEWYHLKLAGTVGELEQQAKCVFHSAIDFESKNHLETPSLPSGRPEIYCVDLGSAVCVTGYR